MPRRKMTWALIVWSALMLFWVIAGAGATNCGRFAPDSGERAGCEAGAGIGIAGLIFLWFLGFVVLALVWFMTRPKAEPASAPPVTQPVSAGPGAGWYDDPQQPGSSRYWNGTDWTEHTKPKDNPA
jgi:hypothetical protein